MMVGASLSLSCLFSWTFSSLSFLSGAFWDTGNVRSGAGGGMKADDPSLGAGAEMDSWARSEPRPRQRTKALTAIRAGVLGPRRIVRRFLRNGDVMGMTLLHRSRGHENEPAT